MGTILAFFTLWPLLSNVKAIYFNCLNAVDFSIYQQAIYDILTLKDPNPFVSIRGIEIFNDHFDPIIYLAVAFTAVFGQGFQQLLVFEWLFFIVLLLSIVFLFKWDLQAALPYLLCALATRLLLSPLLYPIHPTTWSILPFFWLVVFIVNHNSKALIFTVFALCLFKESYPIALFPLGLFYIFKKEYRLGMGIMAITFPFIIFELYLRKEFLGSTANYGGQVFDSLAKGLFAHFKEKMAGYDVPLFVKMFYPFVASFLFYAKNLRDRREHFPLQYLFAIALFFMPLLFLQAWQGRIDIHYGAPFAGILLGLLVSLRMLDHLSKKMVVVTIGLFVFSSWEIYNNMFESVFFDKVAYWCPATPNKMRDNQLVKDKLSLIPKNEAILASGGIVPFIMLPGKNIDHYKAHSIKKNHYHYIILERNNMGSGNIYWSTAQDSEEVLKRCRPKAREIYIDNHELFFAKGDFVDCVYPSRLLEPYWAAGTPGWYFPPKNRIPASDK